MHRRIELFGLVQAVLAGRRVDDKEFLVVICIDFLAFDDLVHFGQLPDQVFPGVHAPGGVDEE